MNLTTVTVMISLCFGIVHGGGEINQVNSWDILLRPLKLNRSIVKREADDNSTGTEVCSVDNIEVTVKNDFSNEKERKINYGQINENVNNNDDVPTNPENSSNNLNKETDDANSKDIPTSKSEKQNNVGSTAPNVLSTSYSLPKGEQSNIQDLSLRSKAAVSQNVVEMINQVAEDQTVCNNLSNIVVETTDDLIRDKNVKNTLDILTKNQGLIGNDEAKNVLTTVRLASGLPPEMSKPILRHQTGVILNSLNMTEFPNLRHSNASDVISKINSTVGNVNDFVSKHFNRTKSKDKTKDPNYNPSLLLQRSQASWKHVSESEKDNSTEVVQACRFGSKFATCSIEYSAWNSKLWLKMASNPNKRGINVTVYEAGTEPRITFTNRVNDTDCHIFNNGTFRQICLKVYGYETELGPTRVCMQIGAALFNKGVASSNFGCFRYGSDVRHEDPAGGEQPNLDILNRYILGNNMRNLDDEEEDVSGSSHPSFSVLYILVSTALAVFLSR